MYSEDPPDELIAERRAGRRYLAELMMHPDCRDPDHPGCNNCIEYPDVDEDYAPDYPDGDRL
jgi:hypothetical protein